MQTSEGMCMCFTLRGSYITFPYLLGLNTCTTPLSPPSICYPLSISDDNGA